MVEKKEIVGDCLEGIGIPSRGYADIDRDEKPRVFDVVWCSGVGGGEIGGFLKQIIRTGDSPIVQTRYKDDRKGYMFHPAEIYGVVLRVTDLEGNEVWTRPPAADAVSVVRCRECMHRGGGEPFDDSAYCRVNRGIISPEFFCGDGRRR